MKYFQNPIPKQKFRRITLSTLAVTIVFIILGDTFCWLLAQHILATQASRLITNATQYGWHIEHSPQHKGGWPFGATLTLPAIRAIYQTPDKTFTIAWHGDAVELGSYWPSFITHPHAIHLIGHHAARGISSNSSITLLSQAATLTPTRSGHQILFHAPTLAIGINTPTFTHSFTSTSPKLEIHLPSPASSNTFGLKLDTPTILTDSTHFPKFTNTSFALTQTIPTGTPTLTAMHTGELHLPIASMTITTPVGPIPFTAAGSLKLPTMNGAITLTFPHWHQTAQHLTTTELPFLNPILQQNLHKLFSISNQSTPTAEIPLSFQLRILNGQLEPNFPEFFRQISTRKIDATNDGE
ncbi:DUF2125 domain-containing protein [Neokomagataea anthophila]|uniref:DUF2125 domain-containing protein n=1 Tax=Neokomagataea anthophila TaxID=2826925 RepID=A0ABS5E573_9PROT|nr:DUF2125 domain-containing protein [Neokomagataea anthophila]